jgi:hypothetical protein
MRFRLIKLISAIAVAASWNSAHAEVFCIANKFKIENYGYSNVMVSTITLAGGGAMQSVSICGTDCSDKATDRNLSIVLTAQAQGLPVQFYFGAYNSCADVPYGAKPFGVFLWKP